MQAISFFHSHVACSLKKKKQQRHLEEEGDGVAQTKTSKKRTQKVNFCLHRGNLALTSSARETWFMVSFFLSSAQMVKKEEEEQAVSKKSKKTKEEIEEARQLKIKKKEEEEQNRWRWLWSALFIWTLFPPTHTNTKCNFNFHWCVCTFLSSWFLSGGRKRSMKMGWNGSSWNTKDPTFPLSTSLYLTMFTSTIMVSWVCDWNKGDGYRSSTFVSYRYCWDSVKWFYKLDALQCRLLCFYTAQSDITDIIYWYVCLTLKARISSCTKSIVWVSFMESVTVVLEKLWINNYTRISFYANNLRHGCLYS